MKCNCEVKDGKLVRICRIHGVHTERMNIGLIERVAELERRLVINARNLVWFDPKDNPDLEDGWYVWRNSPDWPRHEYEIYQIAGGQMFEPQPMDIYGARWEIIPCPLYGELAGPIFKDED